MKTLVIRSENELSRAAELLRQGQLAAVPTETVYGLCADGTNAGAVAALYEIKGRPEVKPLSLMIPSANAMGLYAREVGGAARLLAESFWPGPLTIVLPARTDRIPSIVRAGKDTIGLRCPDHPMTLALLRLAGVPLAGPSANPSGLPSAVNAEQVLTYFDGAIAAVVDGGECGFGEASTIVDLSAVPYRILRRGALAEDAIGAVLARSVKCIGLTGTTGSGKTTVLRYLESRGALGLDCDEIYHELLESSEPLLTELRSAFPAAFSGDALDRKALGGIVFADPEALRRLGSITRDHVIREVEKRLEAFAWQGGQVAVIDAIGLVESGLASRCCRTAAVTADPALRLRRIMAREGIDEDYARKRIAAQQDESFYREHCDILLRNDGTREELLLQCAALFNELFEDKN
ncbi:MAG: threonylcarbamoyl-AMP synthase [Oscillospiraceae bacterium]|nr:threonylcarbamoyl-AMP synthase [Oscillospiraceae bacterium]